MTRRASVSRPLSDFSEDELLEEIARRRNKRVADADDIVFCDDCANFVPWKKNSDPPDDFNPCVWKHAMRFHSPENINERFGFYRRVCADRKDIPA